MHFTLKFVVIISGLCLNCLANICMSAVGLSHVPCTALEYFKKNAGINNQDLQRIKKKNFGSNGSGLFLKLKTNTTYVERERERKRL